MTTRTLGTRVAEHAGVSSRSDVPLTSPTHSAVRDHSELCSTNVDINNFKVLATSSCEIDLTILNLGLCLIANLISSYPLLVVNS